MMFLEKAMETLLADKELKKAGQQELKAACQDLLQDLKQGQAAKVENEGQNTGGVLPEVSANMPLSMGKVFLPFELACQSRSHRLISNDEMSLTLLDRLFIIRLITSALDTLQKLVAYGHISYQYVSSSYEDGRQFDDHLVTTVAQCFQGPHTDEAVQLQVT